MIFELCSKLVLMIIKYHISYVEVFWRSKDIISSHKSYFRQLLAKCQGIFWDFRFLKIWLAIWPKVAGNMICGRKLSLWTSKTLLHNLYDILWSLEPISNTIEKSWFSQYFPFRILKGKYYKNHDFSIVLKIGSNDHKISYKLCRSVLEVQRDNFRPPIIFPATFGQMASHILRSRKSQKSP